MPSNTAIEAYERYAKARDEAGFTDYKVCKACGFGTAVTTNWKKGTYKPKWDKICKIAEVLGADPVWIDRGVASTLLPAGMTVTDAQDYEEFREELKDAEPPQYISVPILGRVAAGEPIFDEGNVQGYTMLEWHKSEGGMYFALEVTGDSMEPLIHKVLGNKKRGTISCGCGVPRNCATRKKFPVNTGKKGLPQAGIEKNSPDFPEIPYFRPFCGNPL